MVRIAKEDLGTAILGLIIQVSNSSGSTGVMTYLIRGAYVAVYPEPSRPSGFNTDLLKFLARRLKGRRLPPHIV